MRQSDYDKHPYVQVDGFAGHCLTGWEKIGLQIKKDHKASVKSKFIIAVECYIGVNEEEIVAALTKYLSPDHIFSLANAMKSAEEIDRLVQPDVTDDEVFGFITRLRINDFFDADTKKKLSQAVFAIEKGLILICGTGASLIAKADLLVYADMPRWEGQLRFRRNEADNLGAKNSMEKGSLQYKRAFFVDWRVCDRLKKETHPTWNYVLDTVVTNEPKMITAEALRAGLRQTIKQPFRVVPFFDPGPWGGQWMKQVCGLDESVANYAWCFDCVPEENSLLLRFGKIDFETPAINAVFFEPQKLLGEKVYARFGDEFPIRFDFLDTMGGGNLSLQVHPLTAYIREHFGMTYTQDESYYMLDAAEDACVYLGLQENIEPENMIAELRDAQTTGVFNAEKHVQKWSVKKHDHILIPAGTVHCSGKNSMVLEISATPYIFTFKLWDWGRMGLDGKPRPINIEHGKNVINWAQKGERTALELINTVNEIATGDGWIEESTGLHPTEFIETRRHWFTKMVHHHTQGLVNVLNLIEGAEVIVESPDDAFEPFVVHYAETFIVPAQVGAYTIRPYGKGEGKKCATIKAFVRTQA